MHRIKNMEVLELSLLVSMKSLKSYILKYVLF